MGLNYGRRQECGGDGSGQIANEKEARILVVLHARTERERRSKRLEVKSPIRTDTAYVGYWYAERQRLAMIREQTCIERDIR